MSKRIYNFNPGPAVLPVPVLEEARDNLLSYGESGIGILEISHRSKEFEAILAAAEADIRKLLNFGDDFALIFMQGGATLQFSAVPMNLLPASATADYIVTGSWSKKALAEARKVGNTHIAATTEADKFNRLPKPAEIKLSAKPAYVHFTSNNTIYGTQWHAEPNVGDAPLICDASSDIMWRPLDMKKYAMIYGGAQKNLGPAGVTLVIIRKDLLERSSDSLPVVMNYKLMAENNSLYNTPPVFAVYIVSLVARWCLDNGGLKAMEKQNRSKAAKIYGVIDRGGFYRGHSQPDCRSVMNLTFRLPSEELEAAFIKQAAAQGLWGLKGHRSVGGCRASIYNAFPMDGVDALCSFMNDFAAKHG